MKRIVRHTAFLFLLIFSFSGCNNSTEISREISTGRFIDAPVEGLWYETQTQSGYTDENGTFKFIDGEDITFKIGSLKLGTVYAKDIITPLTLGGDRNLFAMGSTSVNTARLLQSLDEDLNNINKIKLSSSIRNINLPEVKIFLDENLELILSEINKLTSKNYTLKTKEDTLTEMREYFEKNIYSGSYTLNVESYTQKKECVLSDTKIYININNNIITGYTSSTSLGVLDVNGNITQEAIYADITKINEDTTSKVIIDENGVLYALLFTDEGNCKYNIIGYKDNYLYKNNKSPNKEYFVSRDGEDPLYKYQWHLKNTGQTVLGAKNPAITGNDINVEPVWNQNITGKNINIAVVDSGIEYNHPDLKNNIDLGKSWNHVTNTNDPTPSSFLYAYDRGESHGTMVAGIIAASANNGIGVKGVAYNATLLGEALSYDVSDESDFSEALLNEYADISSNSWGEFPNHILYKVEMNINSIADGITYGRDGKGIIYVFAGGNDASSSFLEDDGIEYQTGTTNFSALTNSRYTTTVAALNSDGKATFYSNYGDSVLISAFAGTYGIESPAIVTTDFVGDAGETQKTFDFKVKGNENYDYTNTMNGTSAATPMVSGVIALILEANPDLTYRDVKYILATTARKTDPSDEYWELNGANHWFNFRYGFGVVDASAAVNKALNFTSLGDEILSNRYSQTINQDIPDDNSWQEFTFDVSESFSIEHLNLWISSQHEMTADLEIKVTSPMGTQSILAYGSPSPFAEENTYSLTKDSQYENWRFGSLKFLDEDSTGTWKVSVRDTRSGNVGTLEKIDLQLYGH